MNEKKGDKTLDSSFYVNDGNLDGDVHFQEENSRNFLHFNSGKVEIPTSQSLNVSGSLTIIAKVRTSGPYPKDSYPTIIRKEETNKRNYGFYLTDQGYLHFSFTDNNGYVGSASQTKINDGKWHEIAVTYDQPTGIVRYYIDGHLDTEKNHGSGIAAGVNSAPVITGDWSFNGDIDSLTLYNYVKIAPPTPKPGDITGDGKVNEADYAILIANIGKTGNQSQGDLTGDGKINEADYAILMANFGK